MKIDCSKVGLLSAIQKVENTISSRTTLPILSNILFEAAGETLELTATDLEVIVQSKISVKVLEEGNVTIPAKRIGDIVREISNDEVKLESDETQKTTIRSGRSLFKIMGLGKEDFPQMPSFEGESYQLEGNTLLDMLRKTAFAMSHDETRRMLNGVYFSIEKGKIIMVSTDGRRLACIEKKIEFTGKKEKGFILPSKAVGEMSRILGEGEVEISVGENQVMFSVGDTVLISRLIEGHFPNYKRVIPKEYRNRVSLQSDELLQATKRVSLLASEKSNSVRLTFSPGKMLLSAGTPEIGEAQDEIDVVYEGEELSITFNPTYLITPLKVMGKKEIYLDLIDATSPGVIRPADGEAYLCVIMPVKF